MSAYEEREVSQFEAAPVECYHFRWSDDGREWFLTSADHDVVLPGIGTFVSTILQRSSHDLSQEDAGGSIDVRLPRTHEIVADLVLYPPSGTLEVSVYRAHVGDYGSVRLIFIGELGATEFQGSIAVLAFAPPTADLTRLVPAAVFHAQCNWVLYSARCGIESEAHRVEATVAQIDHARIRAAEAGESPDDWFAGGWVQRANGDRRFITHHSGEWLTLRYPFRGLATGEDVDVYPGCSRWESDCADKFDNIERFMGFPVIPWRNPHTGRFA